MKNYRKAIDYYGHESCANCHYSEKEYDFGLDRVRYICWKGIPKEARLYIRSLWICDDYKKEVINGE